MISLEFLLKLVAKCLQMIWIARYSLKKFWLQLPIISSSILVLFFYHSKWNVITIVSEWCYWILKEAHQVSDRFDCFYYVSKLWKDNLDLNVYFCDSTIKWNHSVTEKSNFFFWHLFAFNIFVTIFWPYIFFRALPCFPWTWTTKRALVVSAGAFILAKLLIFVDSFPRSTTTQCT